MPEEIKTVTSVPETEKSETDGSKTKLDAHLVDVDNGTKITTGANSTVKQDNSTNTFVAEGGTVNQTIETAESVYAKAAVKAAKEERFKENVKKFANPVGSKLEQVGEWLNQPTGTPFPKEEPFSKKIAMMGQIKAPEGDSASKSAGLEK